MLFKYIVYITSGFQTIQVKGIFVLVIRIQGPVSLKGLSFGRKLVRLIHLVPKITTA